MSAKILDMKIWKYDFSVGEWYTGTIYNSKVVPYRERRLSISKLAGICKRDL
jgi:hypothetical protein